MPGVLVIEAASQMGAAALVTLPECRNESVQLVKIHEMQLSGKVIPGMRLDLEAEITNWRRGVAQVSVNASVNNKCVCHGKLVLMVGTLVTTIC